jgi:4-hydroxy-3-polyprenylbenzoate decarboxylase
MIAGETKQRLVVGISGGSGAILGIRLLSVLRDKPIETHLVVTPSARLTIQQETQWRLEDVQALADQYYAPQDMGAAIASGSFQTLGMVVIPCSIKSLSAVANSYAGDLLARAADVTLKEGRPLILVVREAPLHAGHLRLMELAASSGAVIFPPVPAFYAHPQTVDELVDNIVGRVLQRAGIQNDLYAQWQGMNAREAPQPTSTLPGLEDVWNLPAMTLATTGADGAPHAAAVYFAADAQRENLYFFSETGSQHSQDLGRDPRAAASIHPVVDRWQENRGLQIRGTARLLPQGEAWEKGWAEYLVKFPFASALQEALARSSLYTLRPEWVRELDNRRGFGHKEEWTTR